MCLKKKLPKAEAEVGCYRCKSCGAVARKKKKLCKASLIKKA